MLILCCSLALTSISFTAYWNARQDKDEDQRIWFVRMLIGIGGVVVSVFFMRWYGEP